MLTDAEIDCLFDGTTVLIPASLAESLNNSGWRKREGRETVVLVWRLIRQMEVSKHYSPVPIHTERFEEIASTNTTKNAKVWLAENNFIACPPSYQVGRTSKKYATLIRSAKSPFELKRKNAGQTMSRQTDMELSSVLTRGLLDTLEVDVCGAKESFKTLLSEYLADSGQDAKDEGDPYREREDYDLNCLIAPFQQIGWKKGRVFRGSLGNRLYSPLTMLKSTFRQHLSLDGQELVYVDMQACQPTLLSYVTGDTKLLDACYDNELYEMIATELNVDRDDAKTAYCAYSFGPNRSSNTKNIQAFRVQEMVRKEFPKTAEFVWKSKRFNYRKFSRGLQRREADLFIDDCLVRLRLGKIPVLSIHDCLVTTKQHLSYVLNFAKKHIQELGIKAKFKTE